MNNDYYSAILNDDVVGVQSGKYDTELNMMFTADYLSKAYQSKLNGLDSCLSVDMLSALINKGGNYSIINIYGNSLLLSHLEHVNIKQYHKQIEGVIELLLSSGISPKWKNTDGRDSFSELEYWRYNGHCSGKAEIADKVYRILTNFKTDVISGEAYDRRAMAFQINKMVEDGGIESLSMSDLASGINYCDFDGVFPIMQCIKVGNTEAISKLMRAGASTYVRMRHVTMVEHALAMGRNEIYQKLAKKRQLDDWRMSLLDRNSYAIIACKQRIQSSCVKVVEWCSDLGLFLCVCRYSHEVDELKLIGNAVFIIEHDENSGYYSVAFIGVDGHVVRKNISRSGRKIIKVIENETSIGSLLVILGDLVEKFEKLFEE